VDEGKLGTAAGLGGLTKNDAAAATQVAIWHFSDPDVKVTQRPQDLKAKKLADYLVTEAEKNGDATEPKPTLSLTPASVSGKSGSLLGPITVTSGGGADAIGLTLDKVGAGAGLSLVNKAGAAVKTAHSGDQIYAKVPAGAAAGSAAIEADAEATTSIGRAFVGDDNGEHSQSLILAGGGKVKVNAIASLTWAPKGPIAAATAKVDCTHNGVQVTVTNTGDQDTTVTVTPGKATTVAAGKTVTVLVPVAEDAAYDIKVTGPGLSQEFKGVLNCKTDSTTGSTGTPSGSPTPTPTGSGSTTGGGLAFTGGGGETPIIAGLAGALLLAGGGAVFALRRRGRHGRTSA
jgi:TQXA domain-containing protein